jgi:hypothetical protein
MPVIGQFVSQKNQASVCKEMHSRGSGMCGEGCQTKGGSAAFSFLTKNKAERTC